MSSKSELDVCNICEQPDYCRRHSECHYTKSPLRNPDDTPRRFSSEATLDSLYAHARQLIPQSITYDLDDKGNIALPDGPPFDGEPVLIRLGAGWCEAWWEKASHSNTESGVESEGFQWVCLDGEFVSELDDAREWLPLPKSST